MEQPVTGVSSYEAAEQAGITYRQLTHWVRNGYLVPSGAAPRANWTTYTPQDIVKLRLLRACSEASWQPRTLTAAIAELHIGTGPGYVLATRTGEHTATIWVPQPFLNDHLAEAPGPHVIITTHIPAQRRARETRTA
jgi:DNA-binding transcriptional MerR regulator